MLTNVYVYVSITVVIVILVCVCLLIINSKTKKGRILKNINNLENEKLEINKIQVNAKLIKISMIGQSNVVFNSLYQEHKQTYDNIMAEYDESLNNAIKETREYVMNGDYKSVNENIKNIQIRLNSFKDEMNKLFALVSSVLKDEDELNANIEPLRVLFNECEKLYIDYKSKINFNIERYDAIFQHIRDNFAILNDYMIKGNYLDSKDLVKSLDKTINELHTNLSVSVNSVNTVINVIPSKINSVIDKYNNMQHEEYPLYNVKAITVLEKVKEELKSLINQIQEFDYSNLDEQIESIDSKINLLNQKLDYEKEARSTYDSKMKQIYDYSQDLESLYLSTFRKYSTLNSSYSTNNELNKIMENIKIEDNRLNATLRQLDSLNYGVQPYSIRLEKLRELDAENTKFKNLLDSLNDYVNGIKDICQNSSELIRNSATALKKLELKVRNVNVSGLKNMFNDSFVSAYSLIHDLNTTMNIKPINVKKCDVLTLRLEELVSELESNIEKNLLLLKEAEQLLMFTAQYKHAFDDFGKAHMKAESYFYDCRYDSCIEILLDALKDKQIDVPFEIRGLE